MFYAHDSITELDLIKTDPSSMSHLVVDLKGTMRDALEARAILDSIARNCSASAVAKVAPLTKPTGENVGKGKDCAEVPDALPGSDPAEDAIIVLDPLHRECSLSMLKYGCIPPSHSPALKHRLLTFPPLSPSFAI
jgi:hypothetical protein